MAHQHTDYHTVQDHIAPHTTSDLLYKGALTDEARSIFSGTIRVVKGAQGTDAYQANRNVLLSDHAAAYSQPESGDRGQRSAVHARRHGRQGGSRISCFT